MKEGSANNLTAAEHTAIGAIAGTLEVCINQPTVAIKNALQEGRPLPANPAAYYRGLVVNAGSIAPITAIQFGVHRFLELAIRKSKGSGLTAGEQVAAATGAGATSSLVGCPAELIMIQQQKTGRSLLGEARHFLNAYGSHRLYRGLVPTATRDGLVTAGYLGLSPAISEYIDSSSFASYPPPLKNVLAGIISGVVAAFLTQPVDTVKTRMQAFVDIKKQPEYKDLVSTVRHITDTKGVTALWSGLTPRLFRLCSAFIILQIARTQLISLMEKTEMMQSKSWSSKIP